MFGLDKKLEFDEDLDFGAEGEKSEDEKSSSKS